MIKEEFRVNQTSRYPVEYDKYNVEEDKKAKIFGSVVEKKRDDESGLHKLENFKLKDKFENEKQEQKTLIKKRERIAFEKALIEEARAYTREASKRWKSQPGETKTWRKSMAEIYQKMLKEHPIVTKELFKMPVDGEKQAAKEDLETYEKLVKLLQRKKAAPRTKQNLQEIFELRVEKQQV